MDDFAIAFVLLLVLMAGYGLPVRAPILLLPAFVALGVLAALAVGLWLAALNARYHDVQYVTPLLVRLWMFLSPVAYPLVELKTKALPRWPWLFDLNPMTGVLEGFRWSLFGAWDGDPFPWRPVGFASVIVLVLFVAGLRFFRRMERTFADTL